MRPDQVEFLAECEDADAVLPALPMQHYESGDLVRPVAEHGFAEAAVALGEEHPCVGAVRGEHVDTAVTRVRGEQLAPPVRGHRAQPGGLVQLRHPRGPQRLVGVQVVGFDAVIAVDGHEELHIAVLHRAQVPVLVRVK